MTLLTATQAAAQAAVTNETIRTWIADGRLPAHKTPGGHWRIAAADLNQATTGEARPVAIQPHYKVDAVISAARAVVDDPSPRNILRLGVVTANLAAATKYDDRKGTE